MAYNSYAPVDKSFTPSGTAYSIGDALGGLLEFTMPATAGFIYGLIVAVSANVDPAGTLYFYDAAPTTFADNAAWQPVHADNAKLIGWQTLPAAVAMNSRNVYKVDAATTGFSPIFFSKSLLYCYYVPSGTPDFGAADSINIRLMVAGEK